MICSLHGLYISKQARIRRTPDFCTFYYLLQMPCTNYQFFCTIYGEGLGSRHFSMDIRGLWWSVIFPVVTVTNTLIVTFQPAWRSRRQLSKQSARMTVADTRFVTIILHDTHEHRDRDHKPAWQLLTHLSWQSARVTVSETGIVTISSRDRNRDRDIQRLRLSQIR